MGGLELIYNEYVIIINERPLLYHYHAPHVAVIYLRQYLRA